jgi:hypothetical protein
MANHGYLGDGFGSHRDIDDDRGSRERGWRGDRSREGTDEWLGGARSGGSDFSRGRGEWAEENGDRGRERGWDPAREGWGGNPRPERMSGGDRQRDTNIGTGRDSGGGERFGYNDLGGTTGGFGNQRFATTQHDHYLSWRERQIAELDRDYEDFCREREQQFHQDFGSWRQSRQGSGQQQSGSQGSESAIPMGSSSAGSEHASESEVGSSSTGTAAPQEPLELTDASSGATLGTAETPPGGR